MASPPDMTTRGLNGKFVMNKKISDDPDPLLALQGLSWFTRKAISLATVRLTIKSYADDKGVHHIDVTSNASGLSTTQENRILDWEDREHLDKVFGKCQARSKIITLNKEKTLEPVEQYSQEDLEFLQGKVLKDGTTQSDFVEEECLHSYAKNVDAGYGWSAEQVWSFEVIDGKRYHARRVIIKSADGTKTQRARLMYDYLGKNDTKAEEEEDGLAYGEE